MIRQRPPLSSNPLEIALDFVIISRSRESYGRFVFGGNAEKRCQNARPSHECPAQCARATRLAADATTVVQKLQGSSPERAARICISRFQP